MTVALHSSKMSSEFCVLTDIRRGNSRNEKVVSLLCGCFALKEIIPPMISNLT